MSVYGQEKGGFCLFTAAVSGTKLLPIVSCGIFKLFSDFIKRLFVELHLNSVHFSCLNLLFRIPVYATVAMVCLEKGSCVLFLPV